MECLAHCLETCRSPAVFFVCDKKKLPVLSDSLRSLILYEFEIPMMCEEERASVITVELGRLQSVDLQAISRRTCVILVPFCLCYLRTIYHP